MRVRPDPFGQKHYREGALQRLDEASILLRAEQLSGAIYLAGRAVEGMLRALIWKYDPAVRRAKKSLDTGHDLRKLLGRVSVLAVVGSDAGATEMEAHVLHVARLWYNNMRFASTRYVETRWYEWGEVHKGRTMKQAAKRFFDACGIIVRRCEVLCGR
jgi:HEPN domain-containing protein